MSTLPRYGGFGRRLIAVLLDSFLYSVVSSLLLYGLYGPSYFRWAAVREDPDWYYGSGDLLVSAVLPAVIVVFCWVFLRGTPGKLLMGLNVVDARSGQAPGLLQAILRYLGYFVSTLPLGLGFLWILWDKRKQGFHDKIAKTLVVHEDESRKSLAELQKELS